MLLPSRVIFQIILTCLSLETVELQIPTIKKIR